MATLVTPANMLRAEETRNLKIIELIKSNLPTLNDNIIKSPKKEKNIDYKSNNN